MNSRNFEVGDRFTLKRRIAGSIIAYEAGTELVITQIYGVHCTVKNLKGTDSLVGVPLDLFRLPDKQPSLE
jgi:hypothetical protein